jgi:hypothetical protein
MGQDFLKMLSGSACENAQDHPAKSKNSKILPDFNKAFIRSKSNHFRPKNTFYRAKQIPFRFYIFNPDKKKRTIWMQQYKQK